MLLVGIHDQKVAERFASEIAHRPVVLIDAPAWLFPDPATSPSRPASTVVQPFLVLVADDRCHHRHRDVVDSADADACLEQIEEDEDACAHLRHPSEAARMERGPRRADADDRSSVAGGAQNSGGTHRSATLALSRGLECFDAPRAVAVAGMRQHAPRPMQPGASV